MLFRISHFPAKKQKRREPRTKRAHKGRKEKELLKKGICENLLKFENGLEDRSPAPFLPYSFLCFGREAGEISNYAGQWQTKGLCPLWDYYEAHKAHKLFPFVCRSAVPKRREGECESKRKLAENEDRKLHCD